MKNYKIKNMKTAIKYFNGRYLFLSNFYEGKPFEYRGYMFTNTESCFQAEKCWKRVKEFEMERPSQSKRLGRNVLLRDDWEDVKMQVMYDVCYAKFTQDKELKEMLLSTGNKELIEGNRHGDTTWGMVMTNEGFYGKNLLGITLMKLREDLRNG